MYIRNNDAYWEGYRAYQDGKSTDHNPYDSDETQYEDWKEGYYDAAWDD